MEVSIGNVGNDLHWWNGSVHPSGNDEELARFERLGELGYMDYKHRQAVEFIRNHPGTYAWRCIRRVVFTWTGFWSANPKYLRDEPFDFANVFFCSGFTLLAVLGLRKALRRSRIAAMPFVIALIAFPLPYYLTHADISYRQPLNPVLVILASVALIRPSLERQPGTFQKDSKGVRDLDGEICV
jgi:hypothetical protein